MSPLKLHSKWAGRKASGSAVYGESSIYGRAAVGGPNSHEALRTLLGQQQAFQALSLPVSMASLFSFHSEEE